MAIRFAAMGAALLLIVSCADGRALPTASTTRADTREWFTERAQETGLDFVHFNGMSGEFYDAEIFGPGVALVDYDNDGDLDVYLVQGQMLGGKPLDQATFPPQSPRLLKDRLYRNDLQIQKDGTALLHFTDVTEESGIDSRAYGMGVAAGDYDNDGWTDLYVTRLGTNAMFRNNGNGTFTDVSVRTGTNQRAWSVSASFVDSDRDGWLDLYVGNYLSYTVEKDADCFGAAGEPDYCPPASYLPVRDRLYRNQRDGTFTDVTARVLGRDFGPALGVTTADFNSDGWIDIYVANDSDDNELWINERGRFRNTAVLAGAAVNADGKPEASMGVDAGDFDNDGDEDLVITNLTGEGTALYVNDGSGAFEERSIRVGLRPASRPYTGFGVAWFDFDNDSWLDLMTVNGGVRAIEALTRARDPFPLHQRKQLFRNVGGRFEDVTGQGGSVFQLSEVGRGAAFGDIDNDGDTDVVVGNNNGRVRLLINNVGNRKHWVGVRLVGGAAASRDMLGARVGIVRRNGSTLWRRVRSDGSYASANDPRILVGLGDSADAPGLRVLWPSGRMEERPTLPLDRWTTISEGNAP